MRSSSAGRTALFALFLTLGGAGARAADGALCDDGDACNGVETYDTTTGTCVAGAAPDCDDGNPCTDDTCSPTLGCRHAANTSPCDDGSACTVSDRCDGDGACVGTPVDCNDGNFCNGDETCDPLTGGCRAGSPADCTDADPCTLDSCDSVANLCVHTKPANYDTCVFAESVSALFGILQRIREAMSGGTPRELGGRVLARRLTRLITDASAALRGPPRDLPACLRRGCGGPSSLERRLRRAERDLQSFCALVGSGRLDSALGETLSGVCLSIVGPCHCSPTVVRCPLIACLVGH